MSMLTVAEAQTLLLNQAQAVAEIEELPLLQANGRVLAVPQSARISVPAMDNTQMDGYAVRAADCASGDARLPISQRIPAGIVGEALQPGTAARIFTGANIPVGADAVVMQEMCSVEEGMVSIKEVPKAGQWIRRVGEDITAGAQVLAAGSLLRAQELGLAASLGIASLPVRRKVKVAVFFTGDELVMPGQALAAGKIYNSNRFCLHALLQDLGCEVSDFGIVPDSLSATRDTLRQAAQQHDLIITSGGVSVGEEDHVKPAVEAEGELKMWQIAMKPGKPLAFGAIRRSPDAAQTSSEIDASAVMHFLGLPGNPVSSFVTFLLFVRPFILRLQGQLEVQPPHFMMRADFAWPRADRRNEFLRVKMNPAGGLDLFANQGSAVLSSMVWADGLVDNPAGQTITPGQIVKFIPFCGM